MSFELETILRNKYKEQIEHLDIFSPRNGAFELKLIEIKKELRGSGIGTKIMREICSYADEHSLIVTLSPSEIKTNKLIKWYKEFDFLENKGRNKDFRFMNRMIRYPLGLTRSKWIDKFPAEASTTSWPTGTSIDGIKIKEYLESSDNDICWDNFGIESSTWTLKDFNITSIKPFKLESKDDENTAIEYSKLDESTMPPVVIDESGNILDGFHRVRAAIINKRKTIKAFVPYITSITTASDYIVREDSMPDKYLVSKWEGDKEPSSVYVVFKNNLGVLQCNCPSSTYRKSCCHVDVVRKWIKMKKPEGVVVEASFNNWVWPTKSEFDNEWKTEDMLSLFSCGYESDEKQEKWKSLLFNNLKNISSVRTIRKEDLSSKNCDYYEANSVEDLKNKIAYMNKDIDSILKQFESNGNLYMPIMIEEEDGTIKTIGGRTRLSIAFILGKKVEAIVINKNKFKNEILAPLRRKTFEERGSLFVNDSTTKKDVLDYVDGKITIDELKKSPEISKLNDDQIKCLIKGTGLVVKNATTSNIATAELDLIDIVSMHLDKFDKQAIDLGWSNPEKITSKILDIAKKQQEKFVVISPNKIIYEKAIVKSSNDKDYDNLEKARIKNSCKNFLKVFLKGLIKDLNEFKLKNKWVNISEIIEPFLSIDWENINIKTAKANMEHLLQSHGIKVVNNQIAKADVEKAVNILSNVEVIDNINEKFDEIISESEEIN